MSSSGTITASTETCRASRAAKQGTVEACQAAIAAHGITFDEAADISWKVETGKASPKMTYEDGTLTAAGRAWHRGQERRDRRLHLRHRQHPSRHQVVLHRRQRLRIGRR